MSCNLDELYRFSKYCDKSYNESRCFMGKPDCSLEWEEAREQRSLHRSGMSELTFGELAGVGQAGRGWEEEGLLLFSPFSYIWWSVTPWTAAHQASLSITNFQSLLKLMSIKSVMPSNHLILCFPPLLPLLVFPSIRVFSNELALCIRWPKYWSFNFSISPSSEYSGLISFRVDWFDLLAVQGILKSLLQHHGSKASFLQCSAFSMV